MHWEIDPNSWTTSQRTRFNTLVWHTYEPPTCRRASQKWVWGFKYSSMEMVYLFNLGFCDRGMSWSWETGFQLIVNNTFFVWNISLGMNNANITYHGMLWEKFQWILPLCMKPTSFQSKASVVCSVTAAVFIDFSLKKLNVFSQHIGKKPNEYLNSSEQIPRKWNVD